MRATSNTIPTRFPAPLMDLLQYLSRGAIDQQISLTITFAGLVDVERMARAARLTLDAEPVLGCRFVKHPRLLSLAKTSSAFNLTAIRLSLLSPHCFLRPPMRS